MTRKSFGPVTIAVILGIAMVIGLLAALLGVASHADAEVKLREQQQVEHGVRAWISEGEGRIVAQTMWDDAVLNLGVKYDPAWAHDNVGQFLSAVAKVEKAFVLNGADRPVYASDGGEDRPVADYGAVDAAAKMLVANVRKAEAAKMAAKRPAVDGSIVSRPIQASALRMVGDEPYILTATLVQPDLGRVRLAGPAPIVVTADALDSDFVLNFGDRFLLNGLHFHPDNAELVESGEAFVFLRDDKGTVVGRMDWTPQSPGRVLLQQFLPPVLLCLTLTMLIAARLFAQARNAATALSASESRATHLAYHDSLTGLPNRALFNDRIAQGLAAGRREGGAVGLLTLDLDRFKLVNDTFGHGAGDELLHVVAGRLRALCRAEDTVARLGGDEFAVLQLGATANGLSALARRILAALEEPIELSVGLAYAGVSIGATLSQQDADGAELLRQADVAMYRAKDDGRNRCVLFEPEMDMAVRARRSIEADLRTALQDGSLTMAYQPQIDGRGHVTGVEALVRWSHPERGPVSPAVFVPVAEECGLIGQVGEFTLKRAFADSLSWPGLKVAVNISAIQLRIADFSDRVRVLANEAGVDPRNIELEITEGVLLDDDETTHRTLRRLRAMGFSLALDDFGTGYSSLAYLRRYPVDKIKIDRSFISGLGADRESEAVVGAIVRLARALHLKVIAEGVETSEQMAGLQRAGCKQVQGYLVSRPISAADVTAFVTRYESDAKVARAA